jgi:hypothetical protein
MDFSFAEGIFLALSFSGCSSGGSAVFSGALEDCDLTSQVDSEDVLGNEEMSSSRASVDVEDVPNSGDGGFAKPFDGSGPISRDCFEAVFD